MKGTLASLALATAVVPSISALHFEKRDNPKAIHIPFERQQPSLAKREEIRQRRWNRLGRRQSVVSETLDNFEDGSLYFANVTMGTPPQSLRFHIDTGSSDLWANSATSPFCAQSAAQFQAENTESCSISGTYNANESSTYKYVNSDFFISYADTTGAAGDYATDVVRFGNTNLNNQQFGIGYQSNSSEGVMGIGYPDLEVAVQYDRQRSYANIPQNMANQGLIKTPAYSLWLDSLDSSTGNILFGGVDTSKYTGSLTTVPILKEQGEFVEMIVGLSGVTVSNNGQTTTLGSQAIPVLLDSGSTLMYLPTALAKSIYSAVGAKYSSSQGVASIDCSAANNNNLYLDFNFSGQTIRVDMSQLILNYGSDRLCLFGIMPQSSSSTYTLGDTFIRNAYIVYDLDANTISLAQTNFNAGTDTNIHEIQSGSGGVPSATVAQNPATPAVNGAGAAYNGGVPSGTGLVSLINAAPRATAAPVAWGAAAMGAGMMMAAM